jgi:hypothetical protein
MSKTNIVLCSTLHDPRASLLDLFENSAKVILENYKAAILEALSMSPEEIQTNIQIRARRALENHYPSREIF